MIAVAYLRVSTTTQAVEGVSLDAQRAKIEQWAVLNGATVAGVYADEGISGSRSDNRPGLLQALAEVERLRRTGQPVALVAYSLSRLARSTTDTLALAARLERMGADMVSLSEKIDTSSASGRMVFRLLAVLSEFERDQIAERTRLALRHKQSRGEKTGGHVPFGYRAVRCKGKPTTLEPDEDEQEIIRRMVAQRERGATYSEIAERLNVDATPTRTGTVWHNTSVRKVIIRETTPNTAK